MRTRARQACAAVGSLLVLALVACGGGSGGTTDPDPDPTENPTGPVRLTVVVNGGGSVEFFDNQNVRHRCYDAAAQVPVSSCTANFVRGSEARIQRELNLLPIDEGERRLYLWGGACLGLDANIQPRGGQCRLTMDGEKSVLVGFERRAKLFVEMVLLESPMSVRWSLSYSTQKSGGNPTLIGGTFDCNSPSGLPRCEIRDAYYDLGTVLTLTAGSGTGTPAFWHQWSGACGAAGSGTVCVTTLNGDANIHGAWGF